MSQSSSEKPRPVIRSEEEWRRLVSEYEASGTTMTRFSAERGLASTPRACPSSDQAASHRIPSSSPPPAASPISVNRNFTVA